MALGVDTEFFTTKALPKETAKAPEAITAQHAFYEMIIRRARGQPI